MERKAAFGLAGLLTVGAIVIGVALASRGGGAGHSDGQAAVVAAPAASSSYDATPSPASGFHATTRSS